MSRPNPELVKPAIMRECGGYLTVMSTDSR